MIPFDEDAEPGEGDEATIDDAAAEDLIEGNEDPIAEEIGTTEEGVVAEKITEEGAWEDSTAGTEDSMGADEGL